MLASIIIPTFNRADRVLEAIESVQRQTYPHKQIIVIDDGSEDNTRELVENLEGVEYHYQDNRRQGAARNKGLYFARGKYIATLDSDDVWNENFLAESIKCLEENNLDFVFSSWLTKKDGKIFSSAWERSEVWKEYSSNQKGDWMLLEPKEVREIFVRTCPAPSSALLIRRESFSDGWNTDLKIADDWCFVLEMVLKKECRAAFTLKRLWTKNVHSENIYDGRNRGEIARELEIHDTRLMKKLFVEQLTRKEKNIFSLRIAKGLMIAFIYFLKNTFISEEKGLAAKTEQKLRVENKA